MKLKNHIYKIKNKMMLSFMAIILLALLLISISSYYIAAESIKRNASEYNDTIMKRLGDNIEYYLDYMKSISNIAVANNDVLEYLRTDTSHSPETEQRLKEDITEYFDSMLQTRSDIYSIIIFGDNDKILMTRENTGEANANEPQQNPYANYYATDWYKNAIAAKGGVAYTTSHVQNIFAGEYRWVVSLSRQIIDKATGNALGVLLIDLNYETIEKLCRSVTLGKNGYVFLMDTKPETDLDNQVYTRTDLVYHPYQQLLYSIPERWEEVEQIQSAKENHLTLGSGSEKRIYTIYKMPTSGWTLAGATYANELFPNQSGMFISFFGIGIIFVILAAFLSELLAGQLTKPIRLLQEQMKQVEEGNFQAPVTITGKDEIADLGKSYNTMIQKIDQLMHQTVAEQEQKRKSELKALQAQINPHFLYNTLDSIIWMAEAGNTDEVVEMTSALANLFRTSISKGDEIIPIQVEIDNITSYLTIQKMRYQDKLTYHIDVDDNIKKYKILKVVLQPLVENAILHGVKSKTTNGLIEIGAFETEDAVVFTVTDHGEGMTEEQLKNIFAPKKNTVSRGSGIGVNNVNERIKLYFGEQYGLQFFSRYGEGTTVHVVIPKVI